VTPDRLIPVLRDVLSLAAGVYVFVAEAAGAARWEPMLLGMLFASGPAAVSAYWSARTPGSGPLVSSPPSSSSSSSSSPQSSSDPGQQP
jgi:hypothetical protein